MHLEVAIVLFGQGSGGGSLELPVVLVHKRGVDLNLGRSKSGSGSELEGGVANELTGKPKERLLEVVVGLGRDLEVLEVLLAVEGDSTGLDLALLDVDLVTAEDDGDVLANTLEVT